MMKLGITCSCVLCFGKITNIDEIGIHLQVPLCCGLANQGKMMKFGFTFLLLCAV
jgi:hypothetical protein